MKVNSSAIPINGSTKLNLCLMMKLLTITLMIKGQDKENDDKHSLDTPCNWQHSQGPSHWTPESLKPVFLRWLFIESKLHSVSGLCFSPLDHPSCQNHVHCEERPQCGDAFYCSHQFSRSLFVGSTFLALAYSAGRTWVTLIQASK